MAGKETRVSRFAEYRTEIYKECEAYEQQNSLKSVDDHKVIEDTSATLPIDQVLLKKALDENKRRKLTAYQKKTILKIALGAIICIAVILSVIFLGVKVFGGK